MPITRALDRESITVADAVITLTASKITRDTLYAKLQIQSAPIRLTVNGTDPVASTIGDLYNPGDIIEVWGQDMRTLKMIRDGSTSANIEVDYQGAK